MMSNDKDILYAVLALRDGYLTPEQILRILPVLEKDRSLSFRNLIEREGLLSPGRLESLDAAVIRFEPRSDETSILSGLPMREDDSRPSLVLPDDDELVDDTSDLPLPKETGVRPPAQAGLQSNPARYATEKEIGRGGLGRVVSAVDSVLGRKVAVKEMMNGTDNENLLRRFLREGEVAGSLMHPNIVPVFDVGVRVEGGRRVPYFAMGLIEGRDLSAILHPEPEDSGAVPERPSRRRLLAIFQDVCNAVAYAHDHGVIHRDLKPANVMVGNYGEVYVVDWGLAKIVGVRVPDSPDRALRETDLPDRCNLAAKTSSTSDALAMHAIPKGDSGAPNQVNQSPAKPDQENQGPPVPAMQDTGSLVPPAQAPTAGQEHPPRPAAGIRPAPGRRSVDRTTSMTEVGDVIGTPAYMPPEQALGKIEEIDEKSDIYSLGAILYEMLTLEPPYSGENKLNILAQVMTGNIIPPSVRISRAGSPAPGGSATGEAEKGPQVPDAPLSRAPGAEEIPRELEEIVLKALAREKKNRYGFVRELHDEIDRFLEGEKERERNLAAARNKHAEGIALLAEAARLKDGLSGIQKRGTEESSKVKPFMPVEMKQALWACERELDELEERMVRAFASAVACFKASLEYVPAYPESREALADFYWNEFLSADASGLRKEKILYENLVREYNDGKYDSLLKGDGTLAISTSSYRCRCMLDGRMVALEELAGERVEGEGWKGGAMRTAETGREARALNPPPSTLDPSKYGAMAYHPISGRILDGHPGAAGLPELEPAGPMRLRIHGAACEAVPLSGADVWLFRFEEKDRMLVPVMPRDVRVEGRGSRVESKETGLHDSILDPEPSTLDHILNRLFGPDSPFRPKEGLYLGRTPIAPFRLPMGSYMLIVAKAGSVEYSVSSVEHREERHPLDTRHPAPDTECSHRMDGYAPVRVPVFIGRNADEAVDLTLYGEAEIPSGFVQIPAGRFIFQGDREARDNFYRQIRFTGDLFMSRFPVTCREYLEYLNGVSRTEPEKALRASPRSSEDGGYYWPSGENGTFAIPTAGWMASAPEEQRQKAGRLLLTMADWCEDWPVLGISWEDAMRYGAWRTAETGYLMSLPVDEEWEEAARGADGRYFPFGNYLDASFCNMFLTHEQGIRPMDVDSMPADESPYGVRGLAGNAIDPTLTANPDTMPGWRIFCGGAWGSSDKAIRSASRLGITVKAVYPPRVGIRLVARPSLAPQR